MKKLLAMLALTGIASTCQAATIDLSLLTGGQANFRALSEDFGAALSYKPLTPPASLGITGFDIGIETTYTPLKNSEAILTTLTGGTSIPGLVVPKLHVYKGLPLNIDIGGFYSAVPGTNIQLYGAELRYGILPGSMVLPAVGVRAAFTKLNGVDQLALDTKSLDISISKGFAIFTPYAGIGQVMVNSSTDVPGFSSESFNQTKYFVGANLNFGLSNLALEWDQTGGIESYGAKIGFRW